MSARSDGLDATSSMAAFADVQVGTVARDGQFSDGGLFARLNAMAAIGMSEKGKTLSVTTLVATAHV